MIILKCSVVATQYHGAMTTFLHICQRSFVFLNMHENSVSIKAAICLLIPYSDNGKCNFKSGSRPFQTYLLHQVILSLFMRIKRCTIRGGGGHLLKVKVCKDQKLKQAEPKTGNN